MADDEATRMAQTENGTYIASVSLDSQPVRLHLDATLASIWVRCSVFEDRACETADKATITGAEEARIFRVGIERVVYTTRRFAKITVGGATFSNVDVYIAYNPLSYLPPRADGILGLNYLGGSQWAKREATVGLHVRMPDFFINLTPPQFFNEVSATVAVKVLESLPWMATVPCVRIITSADGASDCLPDESGVGEGLDHGYAMDPGAQAVVLPSDTLAAFAAAHLQGCRQITILVKEILFYVCPLDIETMRKQLPTLAFEIDSWRFLLPPSEYTESYVDDNEDETQVFLGDFDRGKPGGPLLGAPFLRQFPVYANPSSRLLALLCTEGSTCEKVTADAANITPIFDPKPSSTPDTPSVSPSTTAPQATEDSNASRMRCAQWTAAIAAAWAISFAMVA